MFSGVAGKGPMGGGGHDRLVGCACWGEVLGHVFVVKTPPPCRRIQSTRIRNMCLVYDVRKMEGCLRTSSAVV